LLIDYYTTFTLARDSSSTSDSFASTTWATVDTYRGFIQPIGGGEVFRDGKAGEAATHRLYCPLTVGALYRDRVTWQGQNFIVLYAIQPAGISSRQRHKEIILGLFE